MDEFHNEGILDKPDWTKNTMRENQAKWHLRHYVRIHDN